MTRHFGDNELSCKCGCGKMDMSRPFMEKVEQLRVRYGKPMIVSSAFRCENHPAESTKKKPGTHRIGRAIDILVYGEDAHRLLTCALDLKFFYGIGIKQTGSHERRFIHLDDVEPSNPSFNRPYVWGY